jgi:hypothetical protein
MTTQTHTPTPISKRMATIATRKGWSDLTHYGDTDYGLKQHFGNSEFQIFVKYAADGRMGTGEQIIDITLKEMKMHQMLYYRNSWDNTTTQTAMRDELTTLFREYSKEE